MGVQLLYFTFMMLSVSSIQRGGRLDTHVAFSELHVGSYRDISLQTEGN
jgi:hypothetical protein